MTLRISDRVTDFTFQERAEFKLKLLLLAPEATIRYGHEKTYSNSWRIGRSIVWLDRSNCSVQIGETFPDTGSRNWYPNITPESALQIIGEHLDDR